MEGDTFSGDHCLSNRLARTMKATRLRVLAEQTDGQERDSVHQWLIFRRRFDPPNNNTDTKQSLSPISSSSLAAFTMIFSVWMGWVAELMVGLTQRPAYTVLESTCSNFLFGPIINTSRVGEAESDAYSDRWIRSRLTRGIIIVIGI